MERAGEYRAQERPAFNDGACGRDARHGSQDALGNIILLIVGGNDTTRNTMTGSVLALSLNPDQHRKLRDNHVLIDSFVPEVIHWQTPIVHMRRTAR